MLILLCILACFLYLCSCNWLCFQPKIQDELIAREIVINDAEPTVRYKLTKRQTQEEVKHRNWFGLICMMKWLTVSVF